MQHTCACTHVCTYTHAHVYMHARTRTHTHACIQAHSLAQDLFPSSPAMLTPDSSHFYPVAHSLHSSGVIVSKHDQVTFLLFIKPFGTSGYLWSSQLSLSMICPVPPLSSCCLSLFPDSHMPAMQPLPVVCTSRFLLWNRSYP